MKIIDIFLKLKASSTLDFIRSLQIHNSVLMINYSLIFVDSFNGHLVGPGFPTNIRFQLKPSFYTVFFIASFQDIAIRLFTKDKTFYLWLGAG